MGSLQQPIWTKESNFPPRGSSVIGFPHQGRLNLLKPCRSSYVEGSLVTGTPPSSVSVPVPEIGGIILYIDLLLLLLFGFSPGWWCTPSVSVLSVVFFATNDPLAEEGCCGFMASIKSSHFSLVYPIHISGLTLISLLRIHSWPQKFWD